MNRAIRGFCLLWDGFGCVGLLEGMDVFVCLSAEGYIFFDWITQLLYACVGFNFRKVGR